MDKRVSICLSAWGFRSRAGQEQNVCPLQNSARKCKCELGTQGQRHGAGNHKLLMALEAVSSVRPLFSVCRLSVRVENGGDVDHQEVSPPLSGNDAHRFGMLCVCSGLTSTHYVLGNFPVRHLE